MRRTFATALILCATACAAMLQAAEQPRMDRVTTLLTAGREPVRIVCFGDSVTGVYYHTGGRRAWCDMLGLALQKIYPQAKVAMFNAGISGNTTAAALQRIDRDVLAHRPHLVVVMFGLNDIVRGGPAQYRANLRTIVDRCQNADAAVVLCTPNSVYPNAARPPAVVAEFAQIAREVAREKAVPLADCFRAYDALHAQDLTEWQICMSEDIHPSMAGHKLMAETMAATISGQTASLRDVPPPDDALRFTLQRLKAGQPVRVIAMPPYDRIVKDALLELFPNAQVDVTPWPATGTSLAAIMNWGKENVRLRKPHLVVLAVPAAADAPDEETFIRQYHWICSWSVAFGAAEWDLLPILPNVTGPVATQDAARAALARRIIAAVDVQFIDRAAADARPARQIVLDWIRRQMH